MYVIKINECLSDLLSGIVMAGFIPALANISYADLIRELGEIEETIRWCQLMV